MIRKRQRTLRRHGKRERQARRGRLAKWMARSPRFERLEDRRLLATLFWQGDVDSNWSTVNNWADDLLGTDAGNTPAIDDVLVFNTNTVGFNSFSADNDIPGLTGIEIQVVDDSAADDFTLGGASSVTLGAGGITNSGSDASPTTINTNLTLGAHATILNDAASIGLVVSLVNSGSIGNGGNLITVSGVGVTIFSGAISGGGGLTMNGTGQLTIENTNSYAGTTTLNSGSISVQANAALGTAAGNTIVNATAFLAIELANYTELEPITLNGGRFGSRGIGNTFAGPVTLSAPSTVFAFTGEAFELAGPIGGGAELNIGGGSTGTITFSAANTYTSAANVLSGTLLVNGSTAAASTMSVLDGATLGGTGNVAGPVSVQSGGTISPGLSPGTLMTGDLDLTDGSIYDVEINDPGLVSGTDFDVIDVTGTVTIGNVTFNPLGSQIPGLGEEFVIIDNDGTDAVILGANAPTEGSVVGTLNGVDLRIDYHAGDGNDVSLFVMGTLYWQGDIDSNWSTVGNWADDLAGTDTGRTPAKNTVLVFDTNTVGFTSFTANNGILGLTGIEIQIVDDSAVGDFNLGGTESIAIGASGISNGGSEVGTTRINTDLTLSADASVTDNGEIGVTLELNGTINNNGNQLTIGVSLQDAQTDITGAITGGGGITKNGFGFVVLENGANSYVGTTTIDVGGLAVRADGALGSVAGGTIVNAAGNLFFSDGVTYSALEPVTLAGGDLFGSLGNNTFAGPVTLTSDSRIVTSTGTTLELSGNISGGFGLNVVGVGTLTLSGSNTYTGPTDIQAGAAIINGSTSTASLVTVMNGAALGGVGNVAGPVSVQSGGTISPGLSPGTLMTGDLDLMDGSTYDVEINDPALVPGIDFDVINVTGSVTIGNVTFNPLGGRIPRPGVGFVIIDNDATDAVILGANAPAEGSLVGTLNGVDLRIDYHAGDGNDVLLFADPQVNLTLIKSVDLLTAVPGEDRLVYSITISNDPVSPNDATNVVVTDVLPTELINATISAPTADDFGVDNNMAIVSYSSIPIGESRTFTITVDIDQSAMGSVINPASVTSDGIELDETDNSDTATTDLTPQADLAITKAASPLAAPVGTDVTYTISVNSSGPSRATNVQVQDMLPSGVAFVSGTGPSGEVLSADNGIVTVDAGNVDNGVGFSFTIIGTIIEGATGTQINSATVTTDTTDNNPGNDTDTASVEVLSTDDITGHAYCDSNGNQVEDSGETLIGATVFIDQDGDRIHDPSEPITTTDGFGDYSFFGLGEGVSVVALVVPDGCHGLPGRFGTVYSDLSVGDLARDIAAVDFDGSGNGDDLLIVSDLSNQLTVLENQGGAFDQSRVISLSDRPQAVDVWQPLSGPAFIAVAAFGNSPTLDEIGLPGTRPGKGLVFVIEGDSQTEIEMGDGPIDVAIDDFNGDGLPDIVTASYRSSDFQILLSNGDQPSGFDAVRALGETNVPISVATGDFDGDGNRDIALAGYGATQLPIEGTLVRLPGAFKILFGDGNGGFPRFVEQSPFAELSAVDFANLDESGGDELVVLGFGGDLETYTFDSGDGGRTGLRLVDTEQLGRGTAKFDVGDLNQDGLLDIAVVNTHTSQIDLMIGLGDGQVRQTRSSDEARTPVAVTFGDFNGNNLVDDTLAVADMFSNRSGNSLPSVTTLLRLSVSEQAVVIDIDSGGTETVPFSGYAPGTVLNPPTGGPGLDTSNLGFGSSPFDAFTSGPGSDVAVDGNADTFALAEPVPPSGVLVSPGPGFVFDGGTAVYTNNNTDTTAQPGQYQDGDLWYLSYSFTQDLPAGPQQVDFSPTLGFPVPKLDVNADGLLSPQDALLVINVLNRGETAGETSGSTQPDSSDVDGSGATTPRDALMVINELNRRHQLSSTSPSEAEFISVDEEDEDHVAAIDHLMSQESSLF